MLASRHSLPRFESPAAVASRPIVWILRKLLHDMDDIAAIEFMVDKLKETKTNDEFFGSMRGGR